MIGYQDIGGINMDKEIEELKQRVECLEMMLEALVATINDIDVDDGVVHKFDNGEYLTCKVHSQDIE